MNGISAGRVSAKAGPLDGVSFEFIPAGPVFWPHSLSQNPTYPPTPTPRYQHNALPSEIQEQTEESKLPCGVGKEGQGSSAPARTKG